MLRLFTEQEANERAFTALTRFLDLLDELPSRAPRAAGARPARALVPAEAALALRLPAAPRRAASSAGRTRGSSATRRPPAAPSAATAARGDDRALARGAARDPDAARDAARRRARRRPHRPRRARGAARSSPRRTSTTAASGCGRCRREAERSATGYELDDDRGADRPRRRPPLHLGGVVLGRGATREVMDGLIDRAARVVGLYAPDGAQVGFSRTVDGRRRRARLPRRRLRAGRAPRPRARRRARPLHGRRGPVRGPPLDAPHRRRARAVREVRLRARASGCSSAARQARR